MSVITMTRGRATYGSTGTARGLGAVRVHGARQAQGGGQERGAAQVDERRLMALLRVPNAWRQKAKPSSPRPPTMSS